MRNVIYIAVIAVLLLVACDPDTTSKKKHSVPEASSEGGKLFKKFCSACHAPPRIASHKADEWLNIVNRMQNHRLVKAYSLLTDDEKAILVTYLKKHSDQ